jgi:DNA gyrase subunit A
MTCLQYVTGPDFPTGGMIYNHNEIREAYATGHGKITMRAKADIIESRTGQFSIVITEITYLTNKATMIEKIATLVKDKKILGVKALRDESNKDGVRIVIELKKDAYPQKMLNKLYTLTDLQKNFNVNMLALVDGIEPRILNLKEILEYYIAHRREVIVRRTQFDLARAKERAHILEGLAKALDHIDEVIDTIRKSRTRETAHENSAQTIQIF